MDHQDLLAQNVRAAVAEAGVRCEILPCEDGLADTAVFCEHYGYSPGQAANTILVASRGVEPVKIAACVLLATTKLDVNKTVRRLMGVKRASFATAEQTVGLSGMKIGGVVVFGLPKDMPIYVDAAVMQQSKVIMGGGNRTSKLLLAPTELQKLPNATIVDGLAVARDQ